MYGQSNPYAAPAPPGSYASAYEGYRTAVPAGFTGDRAAGKPWIKWAYLACLVLSVLGIIGGITMIAMSSEADDYDTRETISMLGGMLVFGSLLFMNVKLVLSLVWLHGAWSWIPFEQRYTGRGKPVTPTNAALMLIIPYYNLYWMFVVNVGLCDALERMRLQYRTVSAAPRGTAIGAAVCQLIPFVNLFIAPFVWFFYMLGVDKVRAELIAQIDSAPMPG
ncbi:MAG: hypothetical protein JWM74_2940 [Myxococcaceae bacterium]|nr:hypothetical protein [Myxococcaceae bacterium]